MVIDVVTIVLYTSLFFPILIVLIVRTSYCFFEHSFCLHRPIVPGVDTLLLLM